MKYALAAAASLLGLVAFSTADAGPVFLTGHDPDFHAQGSPGAQVLMKVALNFVTGGTYAGGVKKFLFVESEINPPAGHLIGENGLNAVGLAEGVNYDEVDAAGLAALPSLSPYSAIVIASDFGGLLTDAEIKELVARSADLKNFINAGGGLAAFAECGPGNAACEADLVNAATPLFGYLPIAVSSVATCQSYSVTPFGTSLGLSNADVNDPTHNSFGAIGGLTVVDHDCNGVPTTLAGIVKVGGGGFTAPEPMSLFLFGAGLAGAASIRRRAKSERR